MTYPWAAGEVLTASDLNNYAGLVFIKSVTVTGTPTSISVTNVFSSTFRNYRVVMANSQNSSAGQPVYIRFGTGSTYFGQYWNGTTLTSITAGSDGIPVGTTATGAPIGGFDALICNPNVTVRSTIKGGALAGVFHGAGQDTSTAANTGFTVHAGGTITFTAGGVITVYGLNDG